MKYLLGRAGSRILAKYAHSRVLIAFDFDGTLAPIARVPGAAKMRARTRARLEQLVERYPCAVISGRRRADVQRRLEGVAVTAVIGNHGVEPSRGMERYLKRVAVWRRELDRQLDHVPGVEIEDKHYSLALHYRNAADKPGALAAIHAAVRELGAEVRAVSGKQVLNLVPRTAPHKGQALLALRQRSGAEAAIYIGDDVTDEDVFGLREPGSLLSVRIGRKRGTSAAYYLKAQREIDTLLERLCTLRACAAQVRSHDRPT